jgi:ATP phosphoribosyltransferase regulatory subunit
MRKWILPEAIEDILPAEAARIETLRRALLDHFASRGYRLVQPPLVEHLDSLLTGTGRDLELQTFKVVDPLSGRMLGMRADTTPQVARIDAHLLNEPGVTRLCYAGSVLRTMPERAGHDARGRADRRRAVRRAGHRGRSRVVGLVLSSLREVGIRRAAPRPRPRRRLPRARRGRGHRGNARTATCSRRSARRTRRSSPS